MEPGMKVYQERVISEYKKLTGETATVFFSEFNYSLYASQLTKKKSNKFRVTKIEFLNSDIPDFSWPPQKYNKEKGELVAECDKTGLWTVSFEENGKTFYAVHCCFLTGFKHDVVHITICKDEVYKKIKEIKAQAKKKAGKPKIGVFTGNVDQAGTLDYTTYKKSLSSKTVYHKVKETILKDIENFNKNLASSIKNGEKGTRKILIAGPQGTGKSSFIQELMRMYQNKASIMIAKSLDELGVHLQLCSKYKVPAIVVLEDCESFLGVRQEHSTVLNFLSGPLEPKNEAGTYIVFTTNHPEELSDRIKHRPERIDEIYILGELDEKDALEVTKMYFTFLPAEFDFKTLKGVFTGYTGAEIMKFAADVKKSADYKYGNFDKVNADFVKKVISEQMNKYKALEKIGTGGTKLAKKDGATTGGFGFNAGRYGGAIFEEEVVDG